jgi:nucleoside-triphosphatase
VVLIDEIGKMECQSPKFRTFIESLLRFDTSVIATIAEHGTPFIESLKRLPGSRLFRISPENRDFLPEKLARDILGQEDIFSS